MGLLVLLIRVWAGIDELPLVAPIPVIPAGEVAVQLRVAPEVVLLSVTAADDVPEHITWLVCEKFTVGAGFTVMVNVREVPVQPFADGITVMVATLGESVALSAVNTGRSPIPPEARPIDVSLLVHV